MSQDNTRGRARGRRRPRRPPPGTSPGALLVDSRGPAPTIHVLAYSPDQLEEQDIEDPRDVSGFLERFPVTWVNVDGLDHAGTMHALADVFGLHRLALEDVVNTGQRAKVEEFEDHLFIVARMVTLDKNLETEQISLFIGALLFRHGEHFYNFQGLRNYKDKFDPVWEPKYLAIPTGALIPRVLMNIASLTAGGLKGALGK